MGLRRARDPAWQPMTNRVVQQREDSRTRERSCAWARSCRPWQVRAGALAATRPVRTHAPSGVYLARGFKSLGVFVSRGKERVGGRWRHVDATTNRSPRLSGGPPYPDFCAGSPARKPCPFRPWRGKGSLLFVISGTALSLVGVPKHCLRFCKFLLY